MGYVFKNGVLTKTEGGSEEKAAGKPSHEKPSRSKKDKSKNEEEKS
jgi:hypothetical protein